MFALDTPRFIYRRLIVDLIWRRFVLLPLLQRYIRGAGLGILISLMLPYFIVFFVARLAMFTLWHALAGPLGPGVSIVSSMP